jgi:hypothetical protein
MYMKVYGSILTPKGLSWLWRSILTFGLAVVNAIFA